MFYEHKGKDAGITSNTKGHSLTENILDILSLVPTLALLYSLKCHVYEKSKNNQIYKISDKKFFNQMREIY